MFELKIVTHFSAAHKLKMVAKKCENLHGHNWKIEVCVTGEQLNNAGVLMDFGELKTHVADVVAMLDHQYLNELDCFDGNPSSEKVAIYIAEALQEKIDTPSLTVSRVTAWESDDACATYISQNRTP